MPRKLLVPRLDDVRKCILSCLEQEEANKTTRLTLNVFVAQVEDSGESDLRRVSVNHSFSHFRRTERRTLRSSDEPLARWERDLMDVTQVVLTFMKACAQYVHV